MSIKVPISLKLILGVLLIGIGVFAYWTNRLFSKEISQPAEVCISNKFPGKSVLIAELDRARLSVFNDPRYTLWQGDRFYSDFQEEQIERTVVDNGESFQKVDTVNEIYRFIWLRTFHTPSMFRAYRIGTDKFLVSKEFNGTGLTVDKTQKLNDGEWCELIRLLDEADFWNMSKIEIGTLAHDGAFWIVEGLREGRFYVAGQQSPKGGEYRDACIYLMKLSDLNIDENAPEFY